MDNEINNPTKDPKSYYESVKAVLEPYISKWELNNMVLLDDGRESSVLKCDSNIYVNAILKKRTDCKTIENEYSTLVEYDGNHFYKAFDADCKNGILIEELIQPGTVLREETSLDTRLTIFCSLHKELHQESSNANQYPTYLDWVSRITNYMSTREDYNELYSHMRKAETLCKDLFNTFPSKMLLHGDLHHDNILLNDKKGYTIIDPKGVIGDPIFDIPRFILNEMDTINQELMDKIEYIITYISNDLQIPLSIVKQLFYIETSMAECWNVESGDMPDIENVLFAERMLISSKN